MDNQKLLHDRFNKRSAQVSPIRIPGFKRANLAKLFAELGFKTGAEIGVADGRYSEVLCKTISDLRLFCIDPWEVYDGNPRAHSQIEQDECYLKAIEKMRPYLVTFYKMKSMDAVKGIPHDLLDFVYIDGNHCFDHVIQDLIEWSKRVRQGGIVAGHDYYRFRWAGVVPAVDVYTHAHQIDEWFVCDEREVSFFWVKR